MKKIIYLFIIAIITYITIFNTNKVIQTNDFNVNKLYHIKYLNNIRNVRTCIWVLGQCGLAEKDFPSKEIMNKIKNNPTLRFTLEFSDHFTGGISIAKFNNFDESKLAWTDSAPLNPPYLYTLISGEQIAGAQIITSIKLGCVAWIYLFYKDWLCAAIFSTGGRQLTDQEKDIADNTIKVIKKIIDEI